MLVSAIDGLIGSLIAVHTEPTAHIIVNHHALQCDVAISAEFIDRVKGGQLFLTINKQSAQWLFASAPVEDQDNDSFIYCKDT